MWGRGAHQGKHKRARTASPFRSAFLKAGATTVAAGLLVGGVSVAVQTGLVDQAVAVDPGTTGQRIVDPLSERIERLQARHECSEHGLEPGVIPVHSVIRLDGTVRLASFDEGWAVLQGEAPGTLVAVCAR